MKITLTRTTVVRFDVEEESYPDLKPGMTEDEKAKVVLDTEVSNLQDDTEIMFMTVDEDHASLMVFKDNGQPACWRDDLDLFPQDDE